MLKWCRPSASNVDKTCLKALGSGASGSKLKLSVVSGRLRQQVRGDLLLVGIVNVRTHGCGGAWDAHVT